MFPFLIRRALRKSLPTSFYWIESTAPLEIPGTGPEPASAEFQSTLSKSNIDFLLESSTDLATLADSGVRERIREIAATLKRQLDSGEQPNLLIAVHGYNNPTDRALTWMLNLAKGIDGDPAIPSAGVVWIGYHWPSESLGAPVRVRHANGRTGKIRLWRASPPTLQAMGWIATGLLLLGVAYVAIPTRSFWWATAPIFAFAVFVALLGQRKWLEGSVSIRTALVLAAVAVAIVGAYRAGAGRAADWGVGSVLGLTAMTLGSVPLAVVALRASSYFRDSYRATQYGIPDLVRFFQELDRELAAILPKDADGDALERVRVSFLGHSMGAYLVTGLVRILSDIFASQGGALKGRSTAMYQQRLTDSETEEGDASSPEVGRTLVLERLVLVSPDIPAETLQNNRANFLAPSLRRFREAYLFSNNGDEVLRAISTGANYIAYPAAESRYGHRLGNVAIVDLPPGVRALQHEYLGNAAEPHAGNVVVGSDSLAWRLAQSGGDTELAMRFTYIDATYAKERGERLLVDEKAGTALTTWDHARLGVRYLVGLTDGHSGYFKLVEDEPTFLLRFLLRLSCLGWDATVESFGGPKELNRLACEADVKVLEGLKRV